MWIYLLIAPVSPQTCVSSLQDFVPQSSSSNIDYAAIHLWPDNWNTTGDEFLHHPVDLTIGNLLDLTRPRHMSVRHWRVCSSVAC